MSLLDVARDAIKSGRLFREAEKHEGHVMDCHCSHDIPAHDQFLAQKLALMWDEENFLKTANRRAA